MGFTLGIVRLWGGAGRLLGPMIKLVTKQVEK